MSVHNVLDYGPLAGLIGIWSGDKGVDMAPTPDGLKENRYYETIEYTPIGDVKNAGTQVLSVIHYRQVVKLKSNDEIFHDETGYWMWDSEQAIIMHSLVIPRGVCLLAGGQYTSAAVTTDAVNLEVFAAVDDKDWQIIQSPFMQKNARTTEFKQTLKITKDKLFFSETTTVEIYRKKFAHTDQNELARQ